jgi:hypothetical protein
MKPSAALLKFSELLFSDTKFILKEHLRYTSEAEKRIYVQKKSVFSNGLLFIDPAEFVLDLNAEIAENILSKTSPQVPNKVFSAKISSTPFLISDRKKNNF